MDSKVCVVTGASRGIGVGIANSLVKAGIKSLALVARRRDMLEAVAKECKDAGAKDVLVLDKDLSDLSNCSKVVEEVMNHFGKLDILVNNAAIASCSQLANATVEEYQRVLNINLVSPFALSKEAIPHIRKVKGNIIFISSVAADMHQRSAGIYSSSKAALNAMAKTFALEEAKHGVRINLVSPGTVLTDMLKGFFSANTRQQFDDKAMKDFLTTQFQPLRVVGMPIHIDKAVAHLADDTLSSYTTGANLVVDGGAQLAIGPEPEDLVKKNLLNN